MEIKLMRFEKSDVLEQQRKEQEQRIELLKHEARISEITVATLVLLILILTFFAGELYASSFLW